MFTSKCQKPASCSSEVMDKPWHIVSTLEKYRQIGGGIFKVNRRMWFRWEVFFYSCSTHTHKHTHTEHLLSVAVTTQTDIASVKYNLDLKGEWLLSFHSILPSWLRSKGITHQYPPQPFPVCFIIQRSAAFERNIALHGLFQQLNPVKYT